MGYIADKFCLTLGGSWVHDDSTQPHEAKLLRLSSDKATAMLGWRNLFSLDETLEYIAGFEMRIKGGEDARELCIRHIDEYQVRLAGSLFLQQ